jgi:hypothetical protein
MAAILEAGMIVSLASGRPLVIGSMTNMTWAWRLRRFFLERDSSVFSIKNSTLPLFQPYIRADDGQLDAEQFAGPMSSGIVRLGSINVYGRKEVFGEDLRFLKQLPGDGDWHWYAVMGAEFLQFRNRLNIVATGYDEPDLNLLYGVEDDIFTYDRFYGGQLGVRVA